MKRHLVIGSAVGLAFAIFAHDSTAEACCDYQTRQVWVHGRYLNAAPGDAVVNQLTSSSMIAPIINALGERFSHSMIVYDTASRVTHNVSDISYIQTGWTCTHPLDPYNMHPIGPGAQAGVYPDTSFNSFMAGMVLHGAGKAGCWAQEYMDTNHNRVAGGIGYDLQGFSQNVPNGMCVELLNDTCGVPRPAPKYYSASTVYSAASAMYNAVYSQVHSQTSWITDLLCGGAADSAANQVINTMLTGDPWNTGHGNWSVAITNVVTPEDLVTSYPAAKREPASLSPGYYTTKEVRVCTPNKCL